MFRNIFNSIRRIFGYTVNNDENVPIVGVKRSGDDLEFADNGRLKKKFKVNDNSNEENVILPNQNILRHRRGNQRIPFTTISNNMSSDSTDEIEIISDSPLNDSLPSRSAPVMRANESDHLDMIQLYDSDQHELEDSFVPIKSSNQKHKKGTRRSSRIQRLLDNSLSNEVIEIHDEIVPVTIENVDNENDAIVVPNSNSKKKKVKPTLRQVNNMVGPEVIDLTALDKSQYADDNDDEVVILDESSPFSRAKNTLKPRLSIYKLMSAHWKSIFNKMMAENGGKNIFSFQSKMFPTKSQNCPIKPVNEFTRKCQNEQHLNTSLKSSIPNKTYIDIQKPNACIDLTSNDYKQSLRTRRVPPRKQNSTVDIVVEDFTKMIDAYKKKKISTNKEIQKVQKAITAAESRRHSEELAARLEKQLNLRHLILEDEKFDGMPPITSEMMAKVAEILDGKSGTDNVVTTEEGSLSFNDIKTLFPTTWLNDGVINNYFYLIEQRSKEDGYPTVHCFSSFFFEKLANHGCEAVRRWTKKVDLFTKDLILLPVHRRNHWCLACVDFRQQRIKYYDSLGSPNNPCLFALMNYLRFEHKQKKNVPLVDDDEWTLENCSDIPQQMNCSDCGVFACMYAEYLSRDACLNFSQDDMPYFRQKMLYELLMSKLL